MVTSETCSSRGCTAGVPSELETERLCFAHFAQILEDTCVEIRRETAPGTVSPARRAQLAQYIADQGERLARLATSGSRIPDEAKKRILTLFLTLMNLRENMDRAAMPRIRESQAG